MVGEEVEHTAYGIATIKQCRRTFDHLGTVDGKLVDFQSVIIAPLLSFVLDTILGDSHAVEAETTDSGFRLS